MAAEMNDALHAGDSLLDLREIGEVGGDKVISGGKVRGLADIARPKMRIDPAQNLAQPCADIAGGTSNENVLHHSLQASSGTKPRTKFAFAMSPAILALLSAPVDARGPSRGLRCRTMWKRPKRSGSSSPRGNGMRSTAR